MNAIVSLADPWKLRMIPMQVDLSNRASLGESPTVRRTAAMRPWPVIGNMSQNNLSQVL